MGSQHDPAHPFRNPYKGIRSMYPRGGFKKTQFFDNRTPQKKRPPRPPPAPPHHPPFFSNAYFFTFYIPLLCVGRLSSTLININPFSCPCLSGSQTVCCVRVARALKQRSHFYKCQPFSVSLRACVPACVTNIHT